MTVNELVSLTGISETEIQTPNATMAEGLSISRNSIQNGEQTIISWLERIGYKKA